MVLNAYLDLYQNVVSHSHQRQVEQRPVGFQRVILPGKLRKLYLTRTQYNNADKEEDTYLNFSFCFHLDLCAGDLITIQGIQLDRLVVLSGISQRSLDSPPAETRVD